VSQSAQPDFLSECKVIELPAHALVEMYSKQTDFADSSNYLGLGSNDLFDLKIPPFQRGLKWDAERLKDFHDSLIQGWPVGTMAIAIEGSRAINKASTQRKYSLSLIDGQQRSWALTSIIEGFWSNPWFSFENPKWELLQPPKGPIVDAKEAVAELASMLSEAATTIEETVRDLSIENGKSIFDDHMDFLEALTKATGKTFPNAKQSRGEALKLCNALRKQFERVLDITIPVMLLNEALHAQLPTIFRRLNAGVPLKGYDLLAATWEPKKLAPSTAKLTKTNSLFLKKVLDVADKRIQETYSKVSEGYIVDPNTDPLQIKDLSLFDLLFYLSSVMGKSHDCFLFSSEVLAFQVSALVFNGSISRVDDALLVNFPSSTAGVPDMATVPRIFTAAAAHVDNALKPLMAVSSSNLQLKGKVGLTPAVVYLASFLTHHTSVVEEGGQLVLRSRGTSNEDRIVAPGWFLTAQERVTKLKETLPSWFVHDALMSVFSGSRAYEAVNQRVWAEYSRGKTGSANRVLRTANQMFEFPDLDALAQAFRRLWELELSVTKTPQRRRVSDTGAVLLRAAYSHLQSHDHEIDHVIPIGKGKASALQGSVPYPLNHVANLMPIPKDINLRRSDEAWSTFYRTLKASERQVVASALMVPWAATASSKLASVDKFTKFLALRYRALVSQALTNLNHPDWVHMNQMKRDEFLARITN